MERERERERVCVCVTVCVLDIERESRMDDIGSLYQRKNRDAFSSKIRGWL